MFISYLIPFSVYGPVFDYFSFYFYFFGTNEAKSDFFGRRPPPSLQPQFHSLEKNHSSFKWMDILLRGVSRYIIIRFIAFYRVFTISMPLINSFRTSTPVFGGHFSGRDIDAHIRAFSTYALRFFLSAYLTRTHLSRVHTLTHTCIDGRNTKNIRKRGNHGERASSRTIYNVRRNI